jgi:hypothetical protein
MNLVVDKCSFKHVTKVMTFLDEVVYHLDVRKGALKTCD